MNHFETEYDKADQIVYAGCTECSGELYDTGWEDYEIFFYYKDNIMIYAEDSRCYYNNTKCENKFIENIIMHPCRLTDMVAGGAVNK